MRPVSLECRSCGAGAPVDEHFCPQCSRILALGRHGDYFTFFGLERRLRVDPQDLERRFRELSRKFHPDYYYNAPATERLASLERASYLNDAYRVLKSPASRVEYLLSVEGLPPARDQDGHAKVPAALLEEVFALNEELDEIRTMREGGADPAVLRARIEAARAPIERKRDEHEQQLEALSTQWDALADTGGSGDAATGAADGGTADARRATLAALRNQLLERHYIHNLLSTIEQELQHAGA